MRTARFTVPGIPPSPNRTLGRRWQATLAETDEWRVRGKSALQDAMRRGAWDGIPQPHAGAASPASWRLPPDDRRG